MPNSVNRNQPTSSTQNVAGAAPKKGNSKLGNLGKTLTGLAKQMANVHSKDAVRLPDLSEHSSLHSGAEHDSLASSIHSAASFASYVQLAPDGNAIHHAGTSNTQNEPPTAPATQPRTNRANRRTRAHSSNQQPLRRANTQPNTEALAEKLNKFDVKF